MFPFEAAREDRPWFLAFALIAAIQAAAFFLVSFTVAGNHFMLPLDDSYIHLQYAKRLAEGHPLSYSEGMPPSGGMTSPLYVLLLAPMHIVGIEGAKGAFAALLFGAGLWILLPIWVYQLTQRLSNCLCGAIAAGLTLANGHLLWNFLSGMETGLFTILIVLAVLGCSLWMRSGKHYGLWTLLASLALLPLVRPEGAILTVIAVAAALLASGETRRWSGVFPLALLPLAAWLLILKLTTGDFRPAGLIVKGVNSFPYFDWADRALFGANSVVRYTSNFLFNEIPDPAYAKFKGFDRMPYVIPGLPLLGILGAAMMIVFEWVKKQIGPGFFIGVLVFAGPITLAGSLYPFVHQQRYLAPWTVPLIICTVVALHQLSTLFQERGETMLKSAGLGLLLLGLPSLGFWGKEYAENSRDIFHVLRQATFGIAPEGPPLALTDAGVLAYYTNRPYYDLVGLTSREFSHATLHGEGVTLEALARIPEEQRPIALLSYREWFSGNFPIGPGETLSYVPRTTITSGIQIERFPILWEQFSQPPTANWTLDVGSLEEEKARSYAFKLSPYDADPSAWPQPLAPVGAWTDNEGKRRADGGRMIREESFRYRPVPESDPFSTIMEIHAATANHPGAPLDRAHSITISTISNTTGYAARRTFQLPKEPGDFIRAPLGEMLNEAGGTEWQMVVEPVPAGTCWVSFGYEIPQE